MQPIRRSNRAPKRKTFWEPPINPPRKRQPPTFTIYTEPPDLESQPLPDHATQPLPDHAMQPLPGHATQPLPDNAPQPLPDHTPQPPPDFVTQPSLSDPATRSLSGSSASLDSGEEPPYQPYFPPKDRAGRPQNLPKDIEPVQLFQLFFTVKEMENIVKQTNLH